MPKNEQVLLSSHIFYSIFLACDGIVNYVPFLSM